MKKILFVTLGAILGGIMILALGASETTPSQKTPPKSVRLSDLERRVYIDACIEGADGVTGAYKYCDCTLRWFEDNSSSAEALRTEFEEFDGYSYTVRMNKAIDACAYTLGL